MYGIAAAAFSHARYMYSQECNCKCTWPWSGYDFCIIVRAGTGDCIRLNNFVNQRTLMMEMSFNKITIVVSDVVSTTSSVVSSVLPFNSRTPQASQPCHQCKVRITEPGSKLCSQECAINYWEERCSTKGIRACIAVVVLTQTT